MSTPESKGASPWRGPWQWSDAYGDEGGDAVLRENNGNGAVLIEAACNVDNIPREVRVLTECAPEMAAFLAKMQWSGNGSHNASCCPACYSARDQGHAPDCPLDALLTKVGR